MERTDLHITLNLDDPRHRKAARALLDALEPQKQTETIHELGVGPIAINFSNQHDVKFDPHVVKFDPHPQAAGAEALLQHVAPCNPCAATVPPSKPLPPYAELSEAHAFAEALNKIDETANYEFVVQVNSPGQTGTAHRIKSGTTIGALARAGILLLLAGRSVTITRIMPQVEPMVSDDCDVFCTCGAHAAMSTDHSDDCAIKK
jgi:hypothetical protein